MAKACRVVRSAKAPHSPKAAHLQPQKAGGGKAKVAAGKPAHATKKSKVHHRKLKHHAKKAKQHARKVCGAPQPKAGA